jgi:hypothetical protein
LIKLILVVNYKISGIICAFGHSESEFLSKNGTIMPSKIHGKCNFFIKLIP